MKNESVVQDYAEILSRLTAPGTPFELRVIELEGRPVRAFVHAAPNLSVLFDRAAVQFPNNVLLAEEEREWTFAKCFSDARRLAAALQDQFGVKPGDRVGLAMRNRGEWFVAFVAVTRIGAIAVQLNSRAPAEELGAAAQQVGCSLFIADARRAIHLREFDSKTPIILADRVGDDENTEIPNATTFSEVIAGATRDADIADVGPDAPLNILFTSGTTGRSKGAVLTHRNLCNRAHEFVLLQRAGLELAAKRMGLDAEKLMQNAPPPASLMVYPCFHISGPSMFLQAIQNGGKLVMMQRWRVDKALDLIAKHKISALGGPPLILRELIDQPDAKTKLASVMALSSGGQAVPQTLTARIAEMFPHATQGNGWGMSETSGAGTAGFGAIFMRRPESCGLLNVLIEARVVDDDGKELPVGQTGEFWLRTVTMMKGYWNAPEATAAAIQDGWYKTGDVGFIDEEGYVHISDRMKDMVISAAENIYCAEVERVMAMDEAFVEVALFGVPDDKRGEAAIAAVRLREGYKRTEADVKSLVRKHLADYKVPTSVIFDLGPFPRNASDKTDKVKLRAAYMKRMTVLA